MNEELLAYKKQSQRLDQALQAQDYPQTLEHCETLLADKANDPNLMAIKGWCLYKLGKLKLAQDWLLKAFNRAPNEHYAASMLMSFYMERADYQQVVTLAQYCVGVHSQDRLMWHRLATAQFMLGDLESAVIAFRRSLQIEQSETTTFALSQPLLCLGHYQEGFERYDARFIAQPKLNWPQEERMPMPRWRGEDLNGKSLLVWTEQGFGDCIQFTRLVTALSEQGASIDLMLPRQHASLSTLLQNVMGIEQVSVVNDNNVALRRRYDYQSPLMSLMRWMDVSTDVVPAVVFPYICLPDQPNVSDDNPKLAKLLDLLSANVLSASANKALRVGLVWSTALFESFKQKDHMHFKQKEVKSLRSTDIAPVLQTPNIEFYSLQVAKSPDVQHSLQSNSIIDVSGCITSFSDTAAVIDAMDLVISIDTAVAHLAGALNKPVINLLPYAADWRWQTNREDTPWYPSMRLLRQTRYGDWSSVSARLTKLLPAIRDRFNQTGAIELYV